MMAVLNRNQSEPTAQLWDLSTACGKGLIEGSFNFKEAILLSRDGMYLGGNGEYGTEIWSFVDGKLQARLPLDKRNGDVPVDFLADKAILMLGNTSKSGAIQNLDLWRRSQTDQGRFARWRDCRQPRRGG